MPLFGVVFAAVFWLGAVFLSPIVKPWVHRDGNLNPMLADCLSYFGVIYGLLLGLLAIGT